MCHVSCSGVAPSTSLTRRRTTSPLSTAFEPSASVPVTVVFPANSTTPVFDWSPPCGVANLVVTTGQDNITAAWVVRVAENKPFGPPITYGMAPIGSAATDPVPLVRGVTYKVEAYQTVGLDVVVASGGTTFTVP